jgi:uncharacterized protein (DUF362 family)
LSSTRAVIVENPGQEAAELLAAALDGAGFWDALGAAREASGLPAEQFHVLIRPDLHAFDRGSPAAADPALVEALIDWLHERGFPHVDICASADSAYFWAENRDVAVLADLLGYRYVTPGGHDYDVLDLSEDLVPGGFAAGGVLRESKIGRVWRDAGFRISFARNKTDEREGYALGLAGLLGVLPLADKDYHYGHRLPAGEVVVELLRRMPVDFAIIDASVSAHGSGGGRAPKAIATGCIIASPSPLLADFAGALKMGLDPYVSPLAATVFRGLGLPAEYSLEGNLAVYPGWRNVVPVLMESFRRRDRSPTLSRLLTPWLQSLNAELFPLKQLLDAELNPRLSGFFADPDDHPSALSLLTLVNYAVGAFEQWLNAYRVLYDKDAIRRIEVPLGFDPAAFADADYAAIRPELDQLEALLKDTAATAEGLRWREIGGATVFEFRRDLPVPFDMFVRRVDVARTIQFMNDYIGGVVMPARVDELGRVVLQAERNLYLPQPNYLVLYQGRPIDVSKIECCDYEEDRHRMYWKTIRSENQSAVYDDGVVSFGRSRRGTLVRVLGRQLFTLPPFWQALDLNLMPDLKAALVTHAYKSFFERTCANFEALVEGRQIRIGIPWHEPTKPFDAETLPAKKLEQFGKSLLERFESASAGGALPAVAGRVQGVPERIDEDGFHHFSAAPAPTAAPAPLAAELQRLAETFADFLAGYNAALTKDLLRAAQRPAELPR